MRTDLILILAAASFAVDKHSSQHASDIVKLTPPDEHPTAFEVGATRFQHHKALVDGKNGQNRERPVPQ